MNWVRALSSAVRAFGLHPKGRPFKSDSAHHCDATPFSGDVVQLVRTLPCRWLESHTVTANSLPCSTEPVAATIWRSSSRWRLTLLSACSTCRAFKPGPYRHRPQVSALWRILLASDIHTFGRYHGLRPRVPQADSC